MRVEEEYSDVLFNIESNIVKYYGDNPDIIDRHVIEAIEKLIVEYEREKRKRKGITPLSSGHIKKIFENCKHICEHYLGRVALVRNAPEDISCIPNPLTISEILKCLKRQRKSISLWHKEGGRQGYLNYVKEFLSQVESSS